MKPCASINLQSDIKAKLKPCWYPVYTRPHHERKVLEQLQKEKIEAYLPLQKTIRQWSDRKKKVSNPFFSCYVFVYITAKEYYTVLNILGVLRYITFEGKAVAIAEKQIQFIKNLLEHDIEIEETYEAIPEGAKLEIKAGPLIGFEGELLNYRNQNRVIMRIDAINRVLLVDIPLNFLKLIG